MERRFRAAAARQSARRCGCFASADKGRASAAGTIHDYIYPCPMDQGHDRALGHHADGVRRGACGAIRPTTLLYAWFDRARAREDDRAANEWLLRERSENLDRQDAEEGAAVKQP